MLVRVIAAGVNPVDPLIFSGNTRRNSAPICRLFPVYDVAGIVEQTGANVARLKVGDESLNYTEATAVPLAAWQTLIDTAHLSAGQTVSVHGGSGGVGSFAVQIAKVRGRESDRDWHLRPTRSFSSSLARM